MSHDPEIYQFLIDHLTAIFNNDSYGYHQSTSQDLTLYEWFVTPHRIDGLPFHDFMMTENAQRKTVFGAEVENSEEQAVSTRFDLANLHIQRYGDTAIASYTLLVSSGTARGVKVVAHNESRVIVKIEDHWKVVHCHKSPGYRAPHELPTE